MEILTVIAIILGPILAVQIDRYLERERDDRNRKMQIFKTLMSTRGTILSHGHVEALNRIDLEFYGKDKYKKVIEAWKIYLDNLGQVVDNDRLSEWNQRNDDLLADLLYEMGKSLGLEFDKVTIKRNAYSPQGHANVERELQAIRSGIIQVLSGNREIPIFQTQDDETLERTSKFFDLMTKYYEKELEKE